MKTTAFDCVEMKHRGAEQMKETIDRMTVQQELALRLNKRRRRTPPTIRLLTTTRPYVDTGSAF